MMTFGARALRIGLILLAAVSLVGVNVEAGTTITRTTTNLNQPVAPDNGCANDTTGNGAGGITNTIVVTEAGLLSDVNVVVEMTQTWRSDIQAALSYTGGGGTVQIINNHDGNNNNYFATLDSDSANGLCSAAANCGTAEPDVDCTVAPGPTCQPDASIAGFSGLNSPGTWTLAVCDRAAQDTGSLSSWSVVLTGDPLPVELQSFTAE